MKKSELQKIIREEIYRLTATPIDDKTEILRKALQRYEIDLNKVPENIIKGAMDAMDQYADIEKMK
jgi:hypothetical protein